SELRTIVPVGTLLPLTAGSAGKVFLAFASEPDRERLLAGRRRSTSRTPSRAELLRQLETIRRRGWAQSMGERQAGVGSVSAPVFGPGGELVAVVSVSGPETRMRRGGAARYAPAVARTAHEIERSLITCGRRPNPAPSRERARGTTLRPPAGLRPTLDRRAALRSGRR